MTDVLLKDTVAAVRGRLGGELDGMTVERAVLGIFFTGVKLSDGHGGLSFTPVKEIPQAVCCPSSAREMPLSGKLRRRPVGAFLDDLSCGNVLREALGHEYVAFFDAVAPIVTLESVDMDKAYVAGRYGRGDDYINCPMTREEYLAFHDALVHAERALPHDFERGMYFEGCIPVEALAERGTDTLRFGPLRPVGLEDPRPGRGGRAWAVVQLRQDDAAGTLFNLVGFQTGLKWGEQRRVFSMIPGLERAEFVRFGVMHRNTAPRRKELMARAVKGLSRPEA